MGFYTQRDTYPEFDKEPRYWIGKHFPGVLDVSHDIFGPVHELTELVTW